ncbi:glycosyltransferase family 2 protein [Stieleria varia]|uniref:GNT-I family protein n=1 Tax=Stieleria varia TaxID=2528005 RepID=A0A5C6BCR5_9BACT|nr:glycosyltransferase family 2 protein [Stieleria varia]TWU08264.1 hypothetical protein Pla52n_08460 [Stieleria varia]
MVLNRLLCTDALMNDLAVVFLTFNRPDSAARALRHIRLAQPEHLFFVSDGARDDRPDEESLVRETRALVDTVDWPCRVHRIFAQQNMGCAQRVSSAVTKALETVDRVVVLEDDCVPDPTFFGYCQTLLDRYADDQRVMSITGNNFQLGRSRTECSYYFSKYAHCWGWATWRRAWQHFDLSLSRWPDIRDSGQLAAICPDPYELEYWTDNFDRVFAGQINSWAFPWNLACWLNHGLVATPNVNLVSNVGCGDDATHTRKRTSVIGLPTQALGSMRHPERVMQNVAADRFVDHWVFSGIHRPGPLKRLRRRLGITRRRAA